MFEVRSFVEINSEKIVDASKMVKYESALGDFITKNITHTVELQMQNKYLMKYIKKVLGVEELRSLHSNLVHNYTVKFKIEPVNLQISNNYMT